MQKVVECLLDLFVQRIWTYAQGMLTLAGCSLAQALEIVQILFAVRLCEGTCVADWCWPCEHEKGAVEKKDESASWRKMILTIFLWRRFLE